MASAALTSPSQHAAFLATQTVADVLRAKTPEHPLIDIHVSATVEKVFETLLSNGTFFGILVLAVPSIFFFH